MYGRMQIHDFMVWIYDKAKGECWRIGHDEIKEDVREKLRVNQAQGRAVLEALKRVHDGEDVSDPRRHREGGGVRLAARSRSARRGARRVEMKTSATGLPTRSRHLRWAKRRD